MVRARTATTTRSATGARAAASVGQAGVVSSAPGAIPGASGRVRIEAIIQHQLDNQGAQLVLAQEAGLLTAEAHELFASYIAATAARSDWTGRFAESDGDVVALCAALLGPEQAFVEASQQLAQLLFHQMRPRTISAGDLAALIYSADGDPQRHIALLKLDPQSRPIRAFQRVNGRLRVVYGRADNLLPDERHLQKCALLTAAAPGASFDITLLDTQAGPTAAGVAAFFYRGFLGVALAPSPRRLTRRFVDLCDAWLDAHRAALDPAALFAFYAARRAALDQSDVEVAPFAERALPGHPELRYDLAETLALNLVEGEPPARLEQFSVDRAVVSSLLRYVTLELDGGARLRVRADRFASLLDPTRIRRTGNRYELTISTLTLREVSD
ncbi:MAG TPA: nucleoid-associated protein [Ktedonobacterales bacterium]|nr:nucleoid-associated protein [Ktedonobacterales bacterium]